MNELADLQKTVYEGVDAVRAALPTEESEGILVKLIEDIRSSLRSESPAEWPYTQPGTIGLTETTLGRWIDINITDEPLGKSCG